MAWMRIFPGMLAAIVTLALAAAGPGAAGTRPAEQKKKLKPEELMRLHLDSIGSEEARASRLSSIAVGQCSLAILVGRERNLSGEATFWSHGGSYRSSLRFPVSDYPAEDISFDGKKTYVALLNPGQRSQIGQFLYNHDAILKEGLLGGVLSTAWPLLEFKSQKLKVRYAGMRSVYEEETHELTYQMRKGNYDLKVSLYFQDGSYRHIATLYRLTIPDAPGMAPTRTTSGAERAADSPRRVATRYTLEERFLEFRRVGELMLPSHWRLRLTTEGPPEEVVGFVAGTRDLAIIGWDVQFQSFRINEAIDPSVFAIY